MADNIVDLDMLRCSLCYKYPNKRKCFSCAVADEIERLRAENERLRAAGDEMADAATRQQWSRLDVAVAAWQEARRG